MKNGANESRMRPRDHTRRGSAVELDREDFARDEFRDRDGRDSTDSWQIGRDVVRCLII